MKVICDVHISYGFVKFLCSRGLDALHANDLPKKSETPDPEIADYADSNKMVLVTKDGDFKTSHLLKQKPKRLIRITLGNISNQELIQIFDSNLLLIVAKMKADCCFIEIGKEIITFQK